MKNAQEKYQGWMMAITFAEAGEWATAMEMTPPAKPRRIRDMLEKTFMAVTFAEEGLHEEALRIMNPPAKKNKTIGSFLNTVGLRSVRVTYAVLPGTSS